MLIANIVFSDLDSGDGAMVIVRAVEGGAGLALSLRQSGDVEVFLGAKELDRLIDALLKARATIGSPVVNRRAD